MADTETKRRSVLGMGLMFLCIAPVPDGEVAAVDREHIIGLYAGIAPAAPVEPEVPELWAPVSVATTLWNPQGVYPNFGEGIFGEDIFGKKGWTQIEAKTTEWS